MKLSCVLLLLMLVSTIAWSNKRLRSNLNGPEGLPVAMYDDSEELEAEDGPEADFGTEDDDYYFFIYPLHRKVVQMDHFSFGEILPLTVGLRYV